jgi:hypothetical protein
LLSSASSVNQLPAFAFLLQKPTKGPKVRGIFAQKQLSSQYKSKVPLSLLSFVFEPKKLPTRHWL